MLTIDPARRLATALGLEGIGNRAKRVPPEVLKAAGIEPRGELWAAMLDTKQSWDDLVLRHAPDEETAYRILENRLYTNLTGALRAEPRLHRDGAPVRDPRERRVRPHRHRHAADPQRDRLPRRAGAHGRLLRGPVAALVDAAVPRRRQAGHARDQRREPALLPNGRPHPRQQVPAGHRRVLPELPVDVRRVRRRGRRRSNGCCTTSARRSRSSPRSKPRRCTRPSASVSELVARNFHLGALVLEQDAARFAARSRPARRRRPRASTTPAPLADALARDAATTRRSPIATRTARVLRTIGESYQNFSVVAMREAELRAELARVPEVVVRVPTFDDDISDVDGLDAISGAICSRAPHRTVSTLEDLALGRTTLAGADLVHMERLVVGVAAARRPLVRRPVAARADHGRGRAPVRRARPGPARSPARRTTRRTSSAPSSTRSSGRCTPGAGARATSCEATPPRSVRRSACGCRCIPVRRDDRLIGLVTREESMTLARRSGELERTYFDVFDRVRPHDRRRHVPVRRRRGRDGERAARRRRCDRHRRRDAREVREPERGELAAPHGHPRLRAVAASASTSGSTTPRRAARCCCTFRSRRRSSATTCRCSCACCRCRPGGNPPGALVLLRDVSDLRRRDRMLLSKDATIREIHHRVKNNLQTIASLLRLQGRRLQSPEAPRRAGRVGAAYPFDRDRARDAVARSGRRRRRSTRSCGRWRASSRRRRRRPSTRIRFKVEGDAGELPGEVATPLAVVLNELMQNAVDHAFPEGATDARVEVTLARTDGHVEIEVRDNGAGLPEQFTLDRSRGLGLSIVQALVTSELQGSIEMHDDGGTSVRVRVPVADAASRALGSLGQRVARRARRAATSRPLRSRRRSSSVRATPDAGFLVRRERELEALAGATGHSSQTCLAASIWSSARPVVPIGKNSSGLVSRQDALSRQSSASQSWVRIQVNATFDSPSLGRAVGNPHCRSCAPSDFERFAAGSLKGQ